MHVVFTYFFRRNFDGQRFDIIFGKLQANENIREGFSCICNLKELACARLFSLNFSSKSPWCSSIEIWVLQPPPLQKELLQVSFLGIYRAATLGNNFWAAILLWSYSYKKSIINHCYKKVKQRFSTKKDLYKNLLKVSKKNNSDISRINQIMSKLLVLSKRL